MPKRPSLKKKIEPPFTIEMDPSEKKKLQKLRAYCIANGLEISKGCIMRTLLHNAEEGLELLGMIRIRAELEKAEMMRKRGYSL